MLRRELGQLRIEDAGLGGKARARTPPVVRCAILCLERALESEMDSMNGQHGNGGTRDSQAAVLSVLLSILASKRVVLDRQHGRNRLDVGLGSSMGSAK